MDRPLPDIGLTAISEPPENFYLDYAGITYPRPPVTGPGLTGGTTSVVDRDDPAYWRRRVREERKELEEDNERALSDLSRVRAWKDKLLLENRELIRDTARLKAEVSSLTASLDSAQAEVQRLKERYEGTWRDEVALEEELSSPASLPLELLSNIAGFIAGSNNYGTLLNFSLMSNRMWQETLPTLFETVVWNRNLQVKLNEHVDNGKPLVEEWKHIKFLYIYEEHFLDDDCRRRFPKLRLLIESSVELKPSTVNLNIYEPIHADTVVGLLLQKSLCWGHESDLEQRFDPIMGISRVILYDRGALLPCKTAKQSLAFRNQARRMSVFDRSIITQGDFRDTAKGLVKWAPIEVPDNEDVERPVIPLSRIINLYNVETHRFKIWIEMLPDLLTISPGVTIFAVVAGPVSREDFRKLLITAATTYGDLWDTFKNAFKYFLITKPLFTFYSVLDNSEGDDDEDDGSEFHHFDSNISIRGQLQFQPGREFFKLVITEKNEKTGSRNQTLDEWYDADAFKRELGTISASTIATSQVAID